MPSAHGEVSAVTADRVTFFQQDEDPSLVKLLFQFGRYLLISTLRPCTQVANLQGIWNKDHQPIWDAAPNTNINLEMNYWPALPCNLAECQEPLFDFISLLSVNGSKTAEVNYGAKCWLVHHRTDIWAKSSPVGGDVRWALWPMGGAWLCTHLWEHYLFTLDKDFLKTKAYPLLKGCAKFLLDWLIEGPDGYLETNPSTSPERGFIAPDGKHASVSYSPTMDVELVRAVFSAVSAAAEILGNSDTNLVKLVQRLSQNFVRQKWRGMVQSESGHGIEDAEVDHRHLSHLFGLFPGRTITVEKTLDLCKAAEKSLYKRGEKGPVWWRMWKAALWASLRNSENAYQMIKSLFNFIDPDAEVGCYGGLCSNLFAAHPPFQIDSNFRFAAAIAEMLLQSTNKDIYLLPALPRDKWGSGIAEGLRAQGGVIVSICWSEGLLQEVDVWMSCQDVISVKNLHYDGSSNFQEVISVKNLHYEGSSSAVRLAPGEVQTFDGDLRLVKMSALV